MDREELEIIARLYTSSRKWRRVEIYTDQKHWSCIEKVCIVLEKGPDRIEGVCHMKSLLYILSDVDEFVVKVLS